MKMEDNLMTGKELLISVMNHEEVARPPWVPFAGVHAGKLKNYSAEEVLKDGDKLFESLMEVNKLYSPDGQPVLFDLQIEAEILGCELLWAENNPPSVASHPLANTEEIPTKEIVRKSVDSNFTIQLKDGWEFAFGDPDSIDRTVISVHKLD